MNSVQYQQFQEQLVQYPYLHQPLLPNYPSYQSHHPLHHQPHIPLHHQPHIPLHNLHQPPPHYSTHYPPTIPQPFYPNDYPSNPDHLPPHLPQAEPGEAPCLEGRHKALIPREAKSLLLDPSTPCIDSCYPMARARAGTVWKVVSAPGKEEDWRTSGHQFHQQGGVKAAEKRSAANAMVERRLAYIKTDELPNGDKRFQRISWTNSNEKHVTLVQYVGMEELSKPKKINLPVSIMREMEKTPVKARAYNEQLTRAAGADLNKQLLLTPKNDQQIRQLQYLHRKRQISEDQYVRLFKISCEYPTMKLFMLKPRFQMVLAEPEMIDFAREVLMAVPWETSGEQVISYDTQFDLGNFYLSTLTMKDPRMTTMTGSNPTIPVFFVVHERKLMLDHEMALKVICELVPELKTKMFVASSDDEFTGLLGRYFKSSFVAKDENHMVKKIERAVKTRKGTVADCSFYKNEFRTLIRSESREVYEASYLERSTRWKATIKQYWAKYIHPHIDKSALWSETESD